MSLQERHDVLCNIIGICIFCCRMHHNYEQHRPCPAEQLCQIWLELLKQLVLYCPASKFLPERNEQRSARLVGSFGFFKTKNSVIAASGRDCTDVKSCVTNRIYLLHTTRLVSFLVRSDRLPNVTNPLRWIVFATVRITLSEYVLNELCTKVFAKLMDPRKRSDDFLLHNSFSRDGYHHMVVFSQLLMSIISSALVMRTTYMQCGFTSSNTIYILLTVLVSIDHQSHNSSGSNTPELKICKCLSNTPCDLSALQPGNNSEADTRTFFHLAQAAGEDHQTCSNC